MKNMQIKSGRWRKRTKKKIRNQRRIQHGKGQQIKKSKISDRKQQIPKKDEEFSFDTLKNEMDNLVEYSLFFVKSSFLSSKEQIGNWISFLVH